MHWRNTARRYGVIARVLHWTSVALLAALYLLVSGLDVPPKVHVREAVIGQHVVLGLVVLAVMCTRLVWRAANPNPAAAYRVGRRHRRLVFGLHRALYAGVMLAGASGLARLTDVASVSAAWHAGLATSLLLLVALHAGLAVLNQALAAGDGAGG